MLNKISLNKKIALAAICTLIFCFSVTFAQVAKIGQRIPDSAITNIYNFHKDQLRLSEFKAKLILLDFWSPSCAACIESFQKLDSLQKLFEGQIQIIMVNKESLDSTRHLFQKRKFLYKPHLPFITSDKYFNKIFSVYGLPVEAWMEPSGKYYGLTEGRVTSKDIINFIKGVDTAKHAQGRKVKYLPDLFDPQYRSSIKYYSFISQPIDHLNLVGNDIGKAGLCYYETILGLYITAYDPDGSRRFSRPGRTIVETIDSVKYFRPEDDNLKKEWNKKYCFTYSSLLPPERAKDKFNIMQSDLSKYFNIKVTTEKRWVKCIVLVRTSGKDKIKSHGLEPANSLMSTTARGPIFGQHRGMTNQPYGFFSQVIVNQMEYVCKMPCLDQTAYSGNIDIEFDENVVETGTLKDWQKALSRYDLALIQKDCLMDVLVLNDK